MARRIVASPWGALTLEASAEGLTALHFGAVGEPAPGPGENHLDRAASELDEYVHRPGLRFTVPLCPAGSGFRWAVWALVREIPAGRLATYGELARKLGKPGASRAVGAANGANPIPIFIPCHRVVGGDGSLTGYAGGMDLKRALLRHEERVLVLAP